jgi:hypothetical protein
MFNRHHHTHSTLLVLLIIICIIFDSHSLSFVVHAFRITNRISLGCNRGVESSHHHPLEEEEETSSLDNAKRWNTNTNNSNNWEAYSLRRQYQQNGNNIIYKKSILTPNEVTAVNSALQSMNIQQQLTNENAKQSFATNRKGMSISRHNEAGAMLYDIFGRVGGSMHTLVNAISTITSDKLEYYSDDINATDSEMILAPDIPIELRIYETYGASMGWHIDDVLYKPLSQIEIIYTVDNTSDCCTLWRDSKNVVTSIQTTPNSALVLQAGGFEHKVSRLTYGKRTILKMAYINKTGTTLDVNMAKHASHYK